jgi:hypothetical protein
MRIWASGKANLTQKELETYGTLPLCDWALATTISMGPWPPRRSRS